MYRKIEVKTKKPNNGNEAYKIKNDGVRIDTKDNRINIIIDIKEKATATDIDTFIAAGATEFDTTFCFKVEVQLNTIGDPTNPELQKSITISSINC